MSTQTLENAFLRIALLFICINPFCIQGTAICSDYPTLTLEIETDNKVIALVFSSKDITRAGINERYPDPHMQIELSEKYHNEITRITEDNLGRKAVIRIEGETVFSGRIGNPIYEGRLVIFCPSLERANQLLSKLGRAKPDFHLRYTPEELDAGERYIKPGKNPSHRMAMDAFLKQDFKNAERFAKQAVSSEPDEPGHHSLLSIIYEGQGKKKSALEEMLENEKLSKKEDLQRFPGTYLSIAGLYEELGNLSSAIEYYNKVLRYDHQNPQALLGIARAYENIGDVRLAIQSYRLLAKSPHEDYRNKGLEGIKRLEKK